jgi:hypothetical protein
LSEGGGGEPDNRQYSRAFDNIVQDEDDVVGLLAYALYKRAIREEAQDGRRSPGDTRNPPRTVVETYRSAAQMMLGDVIQNSLEEAQRDCQDFRVWAGIMGKKESHYVATQRTCDPV